MTKEKITEEERENYRSKLKKRTKEQKLKILDIINENNNDLDSLQEKLSQSKFKPEAYTSVINDLNKQDETPNPDLLKILHQEKINSKIKPVKHNSLDSIGKKQAGMQDGGLVSKSTVGKQSAKHTNTWIKKTGIIPEGYENTGLEGKGEQVCEYLGTNLFSEVMGNNSPKIRLHKDKEGNVSILSKFINDAKGDGFQTIEDIVRNSDSNKSIKDILREENASQVQGMGKLITSNILFADYDVHGGNVGIKTDQKDGSRHWTRIDNGKALSYNAQMDFRKGGAKFSDRPQTAKGFMETMRSTNEYPDELLTGLDFADDLAREASAANIDNLKHTIKRSIEVLKEAYGDDFLKDPEVNHSLRKRMGFKEDEPLTEESLENKITGNISRLQSELKEISREEFKSLFPKNPDGAAKAYSDARSEGKLDNDKFLSNLKNNNIDVTNGENFDPTYAKRKVNSEFITKVQESIASDKDKLLIFAIKLKDKDNTLKALDEGADINAKDHNGKSALILAIENSSITMAQELLERGADIGDRDQVIKAFEKGMGNIEDKDSLRDIIEKTIIQESDKESLDQALLLATKLQMNDYSKDLLERGADVNARDKDGNTPIILASENFMPEVVKSLIEKDADINAMNDKGNSALSSIAKVRMIPPSSRDNVVKKNEVLDILLSQKNIDVSNKNNNNFPLVYYSAQLLRLNNLGSLVAKGADINTPGYDGRIPLEHTIAFQPNILSKNVQKYIDEGDLKAVNNFIELNSQYPGREDIKINEGSILKYAMEKDDKNIAIKLIDNGCKLTKAELEDNGKLQESVKSKGVFRKFQSVTEDDILKATLLSSPGHEKLSAKSSALELAIDVGAVGLAEKMISEGAVLKKSELKKQGYKSKSPIRRIFGSLSKKEVKEFSKKEVVKEVEQIKEKSSVDIPLPKPAQVNKGRLSSIKENSMVETRGDSIKPLALPNNKGKSSSKVVPSR